MSLSSEIAARLAGKVSGYAIDRVSMLDDTDKRVVIAETGGGAPDGQLGHEGRKWEHPNFQVMVRGEATDYDGPRAVAEAVVADLSKVSTEQLTGVTYNYIFALQSPFWLMTDDRQRRYIVVNFRCEREVTA